MARQFRSLLPLQVISLLLFFGPALLAIFGSGVSVAADSVFLRRLHIEDQLSSSLQSRAFLGVDRVEPGLAQMSGFPGVIGNLALAIWGKKATTPPTGNTPTTPSSKLDDTGAGGDGGDGDASGSPSD